MVVPTTIATPSSAIKTKTIPTTKKTIENVINLQKSGEIF